MMFEVCGWNSCPHNNPPYQPHRRGRKLATAIPTAGIYNYMVEKNMMISCISIDLP